MDEPPDKPDDEELVEQHKLAYAVQAAATGVLSTKRLASLFRHMAEDKVKHTKRLPPRSMTPTPTLGDQPSPEKEEQCQPEQSQTSENVAGETEPEQAETPSRGVAAIRAARAARIGTSS